MGIFNNILESFFSGFSDIGQQQQDRRQSESTKGEDIRLDLKLEFREAVFGCEKQIKIVHLENCSICSGSGAKPSTRPRTCIEEKCENCNGSGLNQVTKEMKITIPAGVDSGTRLRVANEGDAGLHSIPSGDLYIYLFVQPDND